MRQPQDLTQSQISKSSAEAFMTKFLDDSSDDDIAALPTQTFQTSTQIPKHSNPSNRSTSRNIARPSTLKKIEPEKKNGNILEDTLQAEDISDSFCNFGAAPKTTEMSVKSSTSMLDPPKPSKASGKLDSVISDSDDDLMSIMSQSAVRNRERKKRNYSGSTEIIPPTEIDPSENQSIISQSVIQNREEKKRNYSGSTEIIPPTEADKSIFNPFPEDSDSDSEFKKPPPTKPLQAKPDKSSSQAQYVLPNGKQLYTRYNFVPNNNDEYCYFAGCVFSSGIHHLL